MALDPSKIEERIDRVAAGAMVISDEVGGIKFQTMSEAMEFAKLMSLSGGLPAHCRNNPGTCLDCLIQALEWRMSPFAVARASYVARDGQPLAYTSQLIHAVIEARAPIKARLRYEITGEGEERRCKVWATFKGEDKPHEYVSETLANLKKAKGRNDRGEIKGSPLWEANPEVQMFYSASRQWARLFAPDVILGIYTREELDEIGPEFARDVTPPRAKLADRLKADRSKGTRGFDHDKVTSEIDGATVKGGAVMEAKANESERKPTKAGEQPGSLATPAPEISSPALGIVETPPQGGAEATQETAATEATPTKATVELALERGAAARRAGVQRRAIPPEYRAPDRTAEAEAWFRGWDDALAQEQQTLV